MLVLHVLQGPDRGKTFDLPPGEPQLIGRSSEALPITDHTVSRRHAELTPDDGAWLLRDLESSNGTFVNGRRIRERVRLAPGDQVRCGSTLFVLSTGNEPRSANTVSLIGDESLDVAVEGTLDPNADSMILAAPDHAQAASDHLRVIYALTALTAAVFDRPGLLDRVMDLVFEEFSPDRGFILLGSDPAGALEPAVVRYRTRPARRDEGRIPVSRTIIQHVLGRGEGILSTNAMNDTRFRAGDSVRDYGIRSAICVPIAAGRRLLGIIQIDSQLANFTFTESQLRLLGAVGRHTGLALVSTEVVESRMQTERLAAIGQTIAQLSHSIKNILQGLRGGTDAVELALNRGDVSLAKEGWPIIARNLDRILGLTLNMLAFSRQSHVEVELTDLHALVREAAQLVSPICERKRIALLFDFADDMPPIPIDPGGIHQALVNILTNAAEAAPARRGAITIASAYDGAAHEASVRISDNGPGFGDRAPERLFEAFTSTKGQRGTGLGLAVTRKIIVEHGGRVRLESRPEGGATVEIVLPSDRAGLEAGDTRLPRPMPRDRIEEGF